MDGLLHKPSPSRDHGAQKEFPPMQFRSNKRKFIKEFSKNKAKVPRNEDMAKYSQLCRLFAQCTGCGWYVGQEPKEAHVAAKKCNAKIAMQSFCQSYDASCSNEGSGKGSKREVAKMRMRA
jgi:hypothetical protein